MGRKLAFDADRVLHKAMKLFWLKGYEATSMQDLVDELGINRFSVYNTFGDKKEIFIKVLMHYRKTVLAYLLAPLKSDKPARQRLDDYFVLLLEQLQSEAGSLGCMMQNTGLSQISKDADVRSVLKLLVDDLRDAIFNAINEIQREQPATMRSEDMTAFVLCQLQGMIVWRRAVNSKAQIEGQMQILRNTVAAW
ncbi:MULTISPECIES: TetR/AcrR family transcriptional regulator [unclassified Oleiphilus]|uniref:TetR/AcrR family transcriptional regulator n=1 Tax=unclassified Oleiphilus TaxID=2631174 RepID=UPI0007C2EAB0|nr:MULTISPECIES: TetR/AcrR family transcriptional regulator [unclassified Oleiphilus]KZY87006.1 hypothetical protein A3743_15565 [Oleiphilus sp. HI0072]KZZ11617.1 hypothetical protein A3749_08485 [Oleiphilus sp. HI0078]KZZ18945.1 hypothetical protein A3752_00185 [Oleiphilus sp. HI0081]KZY28250.1 hypothetical protein A3729_13555 [Oleiphilus sp. HI0043]KZZ31450.1 hypothetical protein A3756_06890 [Oleiphilus sp. HI0086]